MDTAFILAGGLGTRLRPLVSDLPKPMAPVQGFPFLSHLLRLWQQQGIKHFVISVGYMSDKIQSYFGTEFEGCKIDYVEESSPLGTGGAVLRCLEVRPQSMPFLLLNGDTYFPVDLKALNQHATDHEAEICLSLFRTSERSRYHLFRLGDDGALSPEPQYSDESSSQQPSFANGGVYWIKPQVMLGPWVENRPLSFEADMLQKMRSINIKIHGFCSDEPFIDIGLPDDYQRAQSLVCFSNR